MNGQIKADARLEELSATEDVVLVLAKDAADVTVDLEAVDGVRTVDSIPTHDGQQYRVHGDGVDLRADIYELVRKKRWPLRELRRDVTTLETVFNRLATGGDEHEADVDGEATE